MILNNVKINSYINVDLSIWCKLFSIKIQENNLKIKDLGNELVFSVYNV